MGRVGEPEDMLASIFVEGGKAVPSTYEAHPSYRLVTPNGILTLPEDLDESFLKVLKEVDAEERASSPCTLSTEGSSS